MHSRRRRSIFKKPKIEDCNFSQLTSRCKASANDTGILDVYRKDVGVVIRCIGKLVKKYSIISIDTEFAGTCMDTIGININPHIIVYQNLRFCVNSSKLIQLGISLCNSYGKRPYPYHSFQFNFMFDVSKDDINVTSRDLLIENGVDFELIKSEGIDPIEFSELLIYHNILANQSLTWISFQGSIDFTYLIKLICNDIPSDHNKFFDILRFMFPVMFDIKSLISRINDLVGGVSKIAKKLGIERVGKCHTAGSDSMLCLLIFNIIKYYCFYPDQVKIMLIYNNRLFGLETLCRPPIFSVESLRKAIFGNGNKGILSKNMAEVVMAAERANVIDFKYSNFFPDPSSIEYSKLGIVEEVSAISVLKHLPPMGNCMNKPVLSQIAAHDNKIAVFGNITKTIIHLDLRFLKFMDRRLHNDEYINITDVPIELFNTYRRLNVNYSISELLYMIIYDMVKIRNGNYIFTT